MELDVFKSIDVEFGFRQETLPNSPFFHTQSHINLALGFITSMLQVGILSQKNSQVPSMRQSGVFSKVEQS